MAENPSFLLNSKFLKQKLSTFDSKKSETLEKNDVFVTCKQYQVDHKSKLFWSCLDLGGAAYIFPKSGQYQRKDLTMKKTFVTFSFWCQNFSRIHHFWVWIFLPSRITIFLVWKKENAPKWEYSPTKVFQIRRF